MLQGPGKVIGMALVRHPLTRAAGFTGSRSAGRALFDAATARPDPIPVFAEMSSLNPMFVLPGMVRERSRQIAEGLRGSITLGVGQFCTKPGLIFGVADPDFARFETELAAQLKGVPPATMLHSGICAAFHEGREKAASVSGTKQLAVSQQSPDPAQTHGETVLLRTDAENFLKNPQLEEEVFGPFALLVSAKSIQDLERLAIELEGQLTATVHGTPEDLKTASGLLQILELKAGRLIINGYPTGVEVCPSMNHGGPYPATTDVRFTSIGTAALYRFVRPVCYQNFPADLLPDALKDANPLGIPRIVDGKLNA
jgi:NADP-dependent aldehyde dehydrogenase